MSDWLKYKFDVETNFQGAVVEFADGTTKRIEKARISRPIFREEKSHKKFSTEQMASILLANTRTTKQSLVTPLAMQEAIEKGVSRGKPSLDIRVANKAFTVNFGNGFVEFSRLVFDVEYTVRPQKSS